MRPAPSRRTRTVIVEPLDGADDGFDAPDLIEPVLGYREWVLIGDELSSPLARTVWGAEPVEAECLPGPRRAFGLWRQPAEHLGPAPDPECVCGIYALFAPERPRHRDRLAVVRGAVALWGRIAVEERGMRAEFARIVALAIPASPRGADAPIRRAAARLGVEAVPARHMPEAALA
jgi:hypothetical protein